MITATSEHQARAWADRALPTPEQIIPGLWAIALPAASGPLAYTLVYVFETGDGVALVDTSWGTDETHSALSSALGVIGYGIRDITTVAVTHMHPDHFGLVPRLLSENPRTRLVMHTKDLMLVDHRGDAVRSGNHADWLELMTSIGAPGELEVTNRGKVMHRLDLSQQDQVTEVEDGERIQFGNWEIEAIWTPGHTPGHLCFAIGGTNKLVSGDHVLPTITPLVAQLTGRQPNVLGAYLASLRRLRDRHFGEVLPAHQFRFTGADERIDELIAHHDERFRILEEAIHGSPGMTCFDLAPSMNWKHPLSTMPTDQARLAVKETLAHLLHLKGTGRLQERPGPPSTWWPVAA